MTERIGVVGLGAMGGPMATNIAAGGYQTTVFDIAGTTERVPQGAICARSVGQVATEAEELKPHGGQVYSVAFSPDGRLMASGGEDKTVLLWHKEQGQWVGTPLTGHEGQVYDVSFSPDGEFLASAGDKTISLWSVLNGRPAGEPRVLRGHEWLSPMG